MGKFRQIVTELSARDTLIFSFQGILTKLGTCLDMKLIWIRIANGQISSMTRVAGYYSLTFLFTFKAKLREI